MSTCKIILILLNNFQAIQVQRLVVKQCINILREIIILNTKVFSVPYKNIFCILKNISWHPCEIFLASFIIQTCHSHLLWLAPPEVSQEEMPIMLQTYINNHFVRVSLKEPGIRKSNLMSWHSLLTMSVALFVNSPRGGEQRVAGFCALTLQICLVVSQRAVSPSAAESSLKLMFWVAIYVLQRYPPALKKFKSLQLLNTKDLQVIRIPLATSLLSSLTNILHENSPASSCSSQIFTFSFSPAHFPVLAFAFPCLFLSICFHEKLTFGSVLPRWVKSMCW